MSKKIIISTVAVALLVGGIALVSAKVSKSNDASSQKIQASYDPGTGGGRFI